jgi:hypothetical protein
MKASTIDGACKGWVDIDAGKDVRGVPFGKVSLPKVQDFVVEI